MIFDLLLDTYNLHTTEYCWMSSCKKMKKIYIKKPGTGNHIGTISTVCSMCFKWLIDEQYLLRFLFGVLLYRTVSHESLFKFRIQTFSCKRTRLTLYHSVYFFLQNSISQFELYAIRSTACIIIFQFSDILLFYPNIVLSSFANALTAIR